MKQSSRRGHSMPTVDKFMVDKANPRQGGILTPATAESLVKA